MTSFFSGASARAKLAHNQKNELFAALSFRPPAMDESERALLDIAVALDCSGSMHGAKLDAAKQSLLKLVEHLAPRDTLAVVVFDTEVQELFAPCTMDEDGKRKAQQAIGDIHANSCTNLSGGLFKALDALKGLPKDDVRVRKCLLFTDGLANRGIVDADKLTEMTLEYRAGYAISTFGYGSDHNPTLLAAIAQGGNFYYIDNPDKILHAFGTELGGLISTYAQNVELTLTPGDGVRIAEVLNDLTVTPDGDKTKVACDDLLADLPYHVCVKLETDERTKLLPRETTLVSAVAKYVNLATKQADEATASIKATFVKPEDADTEDNKEVMQAVGFHQVAQAQAQAEVFAKRGDLPSARRLLQKCAVEVQNYCPPGAAIAEQMDLHCYASETQYRISGAQLSHNVGSTLRRQRVGGAAGQALMGDAVSFENEAQKSTAASFTGTPAEPEPPKPVTKRRSARW